MALLITRNETTFFIVSFLVLFSARSSALVLFAAIALSTFFFLKRKEIYFMWSILAPRINGDAPILRYLLDLAREEGPGNQELDDLMEIRIPFLPPMFFIFKQSYIKRILSLEADNFPSTGDEGAMVDITGGSANILLSSGPPNPHWIKYREVSSVINKDRFGGQSLVADMINQAWKTCQEISGKHFESKLGQSLDLFFELYHVMIPAHNRALFGEETARKFSHSELNKEMYDVITETGKRLKFNFCPPNVKTAYFAKIKNVNNAVANMMKNSTSKFMKPLLEANRSGKLSDDELLSNLLVFEYAQAPLHVVFWLLYALSLHPEEEKRVVSEISSLLSSPFSYDRLGEFKYLSKVVSETLRLFPGVGLMQVRTSSNHTQFGRHYVPSGSLVFLCNYLIQRNATYWPNPDEFQPSREGIDLSVYGENLSFCLIYFLDIPFGNGPRQCQGQYFAIDFIKVTVITILQNFKLTMSPGQNQADPTEIGFLRPSQPVFFQFEKRVLPTPTVPAAPATTLTATISSPTLFNSPPSSSPSLSIASPVSSSVPVSSVSRKKKLPPMLSRQSKAATLQSQSQFFKDSFISIGKIKNTHDLLVLYGSQTGNARNLATRIVHMAGLCKLSTTLVVLSELDIKTLQQYKAVVVVTSTYGDGGAPENAEKFENWLEKEDPAEGEFKDVPYAVLSLGSSLYPFPFRFGTFLSRRFSQFGAKPIIPDEKIDEIKYNQNEVFTEWSSKLFDAISKMTKMDASSRSLVAKNKMLGFQNFDFNLLQAPFKLTFTNKSLKKENRIHYDNNAVLATVASNVLVNSEPSNPIYSLDLSFKNSELSFLTGDNVIVVPSNPADLVDTLIKRIGYEKDVVFNVEGQELSAVNDLSCTLGNNKCTLEIALSHYYDITSPPSSSMLQFLAMHSTDTEDQKTLLSYSSNYLSFLHHNYTVMDILEDTPSVTFEGNTQKKEEILAVFLGLLGPIKHKHYSIANSPDASSNTVRIIYKVVNYTTKSGKEKRGICSNYMKSKAIGETVPISIVKSKFRLPTDSSLPILMVGAGSGISPYFGFIEQRIHNKKNGDNLGKAVLIHGCRSEIDFANKDKAETALLEGTISDLWPAYSRRANVPSVHVQDIFQEKGEEVWKMLNEEGGIVYMCGDVKVSLVVRDALVRVAQTHGKLGPFQANTWLAKLTKDGRVRNDEWGIATTSGEHAIRTARLKLWRKSILAIFAFSKKQ